MKKLLGIVVLGLLLNGCATTDSLVSKGKIKQGLTKSELQDVLWTSYPDDDPFLPGGGSMPFTIIMQKLFGVKVEMLIMFLGMFQKQFLVAYFSAD